MRLGFTGLLTAVYMAGMATSIEAADSGEKKAEPNRLIHSKSPYLLQHAYNPVDWYPWGEEAFE